MSLRADYDFLQSWLEPIPRRPASPDDSGGEAPAPCAQHPGQARLASPPAKDTKKANAELSEWKKALAVNSSSSSASGGGTNEMAAVVCVDTPERATRIGYAQRAHDSPSWNSSHPSTKFIHTGVFTSADNRNQAVKVEKVNRQKLKVLGIPQPKTDCEIVTPDEVRHDVQWLGLFLPQDAENKTEVIVDRGPGFDFATADFEHVKPPDLIVNGVQYDSLAWRKDDAPKLQMNTKIHVIKVQDYGIKGKYVFFSDGSVVENPEPKKPALTAAQRARRGIRDVPVKIKSVDDSCDGIVVLSDNRRFLNPLSRVTVHLVVGDAIPNTVLCAYSRGGTRMTVTFKTVRGKEYWLPETRIPWSPSDDPAEVAFATTCDHPDGCHSDPRIEKLGYHCNARGVFIDVRPVVTSSRVGDGLQTTADAAGGDSSLIDLPMSPRSPFSPKSPGSPGSGAKKSLWGGVKIAVRGGGAGDNYWENRPRVPGPRGSERKAWKDRTRLDNEEDKMEDRNRANSVRNPPLARAKLAKGTLEYDKPWWDTLVVPAEVRMVNDKVVEPDDDEGGGKRKSAEEQEEEAKKKEEPVDQKDIKAPGPIGGVPDPSISGPDYPADDDYGNPLPKRVPGGAKPKPNDGGAKAEGSPPGSPGSP